MSNKVAKTLHALRSLKNFTSTEMAEKLGMSQAQYSKLENGKKEISLQKLEDIAIALQLSLKDFLALILEERLIKIPSHPSEPVKPASSEFANNLSAIEQIFHPQFIEACRKYMEYINRVQQEHLPG
jgi:transcriptional regulator with XRE-family HTH domain